MKALWKKHRLLFLGLLALVCLLVLAAGWSALQADPRTESGYMSDLTAVLFGPDGKKYIIAGGSTSILVLNEEHQYLRTLSGGQQSQGFYYARAWPPMKRGTCTSATRSWVKTEKTSKANALPFMIKTGALWIICMNCLGRAPRETTGCAFRICGGGMESFGLSR